MKKILYTVAACTILALGACNKKVHDPYLNTINHLTAHPWIVQYVAYASGDTANVWLDNPIHTFKRNGDYIVRSFNMSTGNYDDLSGHWKFSGRDSLLTTAYESQQSSSKIIYIDRDVIMMEWGTPKATVKYVPFKQ